MTLEEVYYVGQTVAVVAILSSLGAIWFQMKQSANMERASAQRELLEQVSEFTRRIGDKEWDHLLLGLDDFEGASYETKLATHTKLLEFIFITESALNMHNDGFFSAGTWAGIDGVMLAMLRTPGGRQFWDYTQNFIGFEIADHINTRLKELGTDGPNFLDSVPFYRPRLAELRSGNSEAQIPDQSEIEDAAT